MMALVGLIGIYVLNHFPGNILSSLIGQSGSSVFASWMVSTYIFFSYNPERKKEPLGSLNTATLQLTTVVAGSLRGIGISLGLKQSLTPVFRFGISPTTT
jgi:hypothetical protein